jgi:hypothetical protein
VAKAHIFVKLKTDNNTDPLVARAELVGVLVSVPFPMGECITFSSVVKEIVIGIAVVVVLNSA